MSSFLAFDLGASSGRAIIGSLESGKLTLTEVHRFANGPTEQGGSIYWNYPQLVEELKTGLAKALKVDPAIAGIGIDTWGVDFVLLDADDNLVGDAAGPITTVTFAPATPKMTSGARSPAKSSMRVPESSAWSSTPPTSLPPTSANTRKTLKTAIF